MGAVAVTYGLTEKQNAILTQCFGDSCVAADHLDALFSPDVVVPVVNPDRLNETEQQALNKGFERLQPFTVVLLTSMEDVRFTYVLEKHPESMADTIAVIREVQALPERLNKASERAAKMETAIDDLVKEASKESYMIDQIIRTVNTCIPFELLTALMEHVPSLKRREKVPYRTELRSLLTAAKMAYGLNDAEDAAFLDSELCDKPWVLTLSEMLRFHYQKTADKNHPFRKEVKE
ncbi:MAG: hypothetical protein LKE33_12955 [Acidaminococcus sp.]|jgi:hypothetical protein|nr:hypothetical protein [Acidaminococcus sp.]MCI2100711.1 hypothetical protein [Acidaminococcus sp.]MCI2115032.1 hypothetical protein [Acidaminococcus sp.]MCI2117108.1 hypothetical protein [Acidaminococcus sp.]